jgi:hypothetical protein
MITCQEKALEHLKMGLFDVLPSGSLDGLTSEDLRLLLNGVSYFLFERGNKNATKYIQIRKMSTLVGF